MDISEMKKNTENINDFIANEAIKAYKLTSCAIELYLEYIDFLYASVDNERFEIALKIINQLKENKYILKTTIELMSEDGIVTIVDSQIMLSFIKKSILAAEKMNQSVPYLIIFRKKYVEIWRQRREIEHQ